MAARAAGRMRHLAFALGVALLVTTSVAVGVAAVDITPPAAGLSKAALKVPKKTLMGPGPSNAHPRVLQAAGLPLLGHLHPEFVKIMDEIKDWLKYAFQTSNTRTFPISGTGHAGMESAVANFVEAGDKVLVGMNGIWGERMKILVERYGGVVVPLPKPHGEAFTLAEVGAALGANPGIAIVFLTHGESSTGVLQPIDGMGALVHAHDALFFLDTVCTLGCVPFRVDADGVDITYSGSQKCLGAPPGTSPLSVSDRALAKYAARKAPPSTYYFDLSLLSDYWIGIGGDASKRFYHHTGPISSMYALREALTILGEEGLDRAWQRHAANAARLWAGLDALGLELFVKDPAHRLPTVTTIVVPDGVQWKDVTDFLMQKYRLEISGGLGPTAGKVWRVGLMGYNSTPEKVDALLRALKDGLDHVGWKGAKEEL